LSFEVRVDHDISRAWHVVLVETLDVKPSIVTRAGKVHTLMTHLTSEHFSCARVGRSVSWQEKQHLIARLHHALIHTTGKDITDTLDAVNIGDPAGHWSAAGAFRHAEELVKAITQCINVDGLLTNDPVHTLPAWHVVEEMHLLGVGSMLHRDAYTSVEFPLRCRLGSQNPATKPDFETGAMQDQE